MPGFEGQQRYRLRTGRNWATVLFVPLIPLNQVGAFVQCRECKSNLPVDVLGPEQQTMPGSSADGVETPDVIYDVGDWATEHVDEVLRDLSERNVPHAVEEPGLLVVDKRHEKLLDALVAEITGEPATTEVADREVSYTTDDWLASQTREIRAELANAGVDFYFDDGALVVPKSDESAADAVIARITGHDLTPGG